MRLMELLKTQDNSGGSIIYTKLQESAHKEFIELEYFNNKIAVPIKYCGDWTGRMWAAVTADQVTSLLRNEMTAEEFCSLSWQASI